MSDFVPFWSQRQIVEITQEDIDAFDMERFQFAKDAPGQAARGELESVRAASLLLIETAMGGFPAVEPAKTANGTDDTVW